MVKMKLKTTEEMIKKLQLLIGKTKLRFHQNISN